MADICLDALDKNIKICYTVKNGRERKRTVMSGGIRHILFMLIPKDEYFFKYSSSTKKCQAETAWHFSL